MPRRSLSAEGGFVMTLYFLLPREEPTYDNVGRGDPTLTWLDSARHDIALLFTPSVEEK